VLREAIQITGTALLAAISIGFSGPERIEVTGEDFYTYGDNESLVSAKETARSIAIRRAIESYQVFVSATSTVQDFQLKDDLVQTISKGYLHDLKVEQTQEGQRIHVKVRGYVVPSEIKAVLDQALLRTQGKARRNGKQGDLDCHDFPSQAAAQSELRAHPSDPHRLDRNRDGIACENNPPPNDTTPVQRQRR
jgi:hypothetical protein